MNKIGNLIIDILYPKFCINCKKEGFYLCDDCLSLIEIMDRAYCPFCFPAKSSTGTCLNCKKNHYLDGLYFACSYENKTIKKLIHEFKYEPFVKDYSELFAFLLISHLANLKKTFSDFKEFVVIPVPIYIKKKKARGYNQAEEIAKQFAKYLKLEVLTDILIKTKNTVSQTELTKEQRKENIKNAFLIKESQEIKNKNILLIDDVFTSGATLDECSKTLKEAGVKEVWGMAIARGN